MLFYYFKSKKDLFLYLVEFGLNFINREHLSKINESETDFIERYKQAARIKMEVYHKNPHVFNFFGTVYINEDTALPDEFKEKINEMRNMGYAKLFSNIDRSLFRDDVSHEHIIKLIHWSMNGFSEEIIQDFKGRKLSSVDLDPYWDDFYEYLADLKKILYKQEGS